MRRLLAYLIMMLTAIGAIVFNTQSVLEGMNDAMEFGRGTELVYAISKRDPANYDSTSYPNLSAEESPNLNEINIAEKVMARLDLAGVRNADVQVVEGTDDNVGYELRVTISPLSDTELSNVKDILSHTGSLTIGTFGDDYLMTQDAGQFFSTEDIATLVYNGTTPYPAINVSSTTDFETMENQASTAGENHANDTVEGEEADTSEEEDGEAADDGRGTTLYLWMNKTIDDTFDKAYGVNGTPIVQETRDKVLAELDVSNFDSDNMRIIITSTIDGESFSISTARAFVNALNSVDYDFDIEYLYENSVAPAFGNGSINIAYLVSGIAIAAVAILLVLLFGISGLTASVTMAASGFVSLWVATALGFEFSIASLSALAVVLALSVFLSINYFVHVRLEAGKKRSLEKANREGYHQAFFISLDASVVLLIVSLFGFLFANGSFQTFFGVVMVGTILTFFLTTYLNKWATYWLVKDSEKGIFPAFALLGAKKEGSGQKKFVSPEKKHWSRFAFPIVGILSLALLAVSLPVSNALGGSGFTIFNNSGSYAEGYTLNISYTTELTAYDRLSNSERFLSYLEAIGADENSTDHFYPVSSEEVNETPDSPYVFVYYPETASVNILEKSDEKGELYYETYFSVDVDRDLSDLELASGILFTNYVSQAILDDSFTLTENNVVIRPGQDPHFVTDSLIVGAYTLQPTNVYHSSVNLFLLVFVLPLLVFAYLLIRYGILTSLAGLATGEVYAALLVGLLSATRIPFNSYSAFGLLAGFSLALLLVVPLIGMNKVILKEKGIRRDATAEERAEITNAEAGKALPVLIGTILSLSVLSLAFFFLDASTIALGAIQLASALLVLPFLLLFSLPLYHFLSVHVSFRHVRSLYEKHREKHGYTKAKPAKDGIVYVDEDSPHETIIPGLNDFLR